MNKLSNELFQEVVNIADNDDKYRPSLALRKLASTYKRGHDAESRKYPTLQSHRKRFIAKMDKFADAVKEGTLTFDGVVQAIASADSLMKGMDIKDIRFTDVVAKCQQVVRDEIARRKKMGKIHAVLELIIALLQSRHPVRSDFKVDTGSKVGLYTVIDLDKAILEDTMGNVSYMRLEAAKRAVPAGGKRDFSNPANVRAYVDAINTYRQSSYVSHLNQSGHRTNSCKSYPSVSASYLVIDETRAIEINLQLKPESGGETSGGVLFEHLPASFESYLDYKHPFIGVAQALFKPVLPGEGYKVRPLQGDDDFDKFLQEWAAMAVATSKLFSCKMVEEIRLHAAFVDMAA